MDKEKYMRTELEVIHFHTEDVITTTTSSGDAVEESNSDSGGGSLINPT